MTSEKNRALEMMSSFEMQIIGGRNANGGGSESILEIVMPFFDTCRRVTSCVNERDWQVIKNITAIAEAGLYAALNTFCEEDVCGEDYSHVKDIFSELAKLLDDFLANARPLTVRIVDGKIEHVRPTNQITTNWEEKISCISKILYENQKEARDNVLTAYTHSRSENLVWSYKELWQVIHCLNEDWDALRQKGFSIDVYYAYLMSTAYSQENDFMAILNGKCKLIPVYQYQQIGYATVEKECPDTARIEHGAMGQTFLLVDNY